MNKNILCLTAIVVAAIAAAVTFTLTGHPVPDWDTAVILAGIGGHLGALIPAGSTNTLSTDLSTLAQHAISEVAALVTPAAPKPSPLPAPAPATDAPPATSS